MENKSYIAVVQCHIVKQRCSGYFCEKSFGVEIKGLPVTVTNAPVPEKDLGHFRDMLRYLENFEEEFCAQETFEILGKPKLSIEEAINIIL